MQYVPPVLRSDDFFVEHLTDVPDHLRLHADPAADPEEVEILKRGAYDEKN